MTISTAIAPYRVLVPVPSAVYISHHSLGHLYLFLPRRTNSMAQDVSAESKAKGAWYGAMAADMTSVQAMYSQMWLPHSTTTVLNHMPTLVVAGYHVCITLQSCRVYWGLHQMSGKQDAGLPTPCRNAFGQHLGRGSHHSQEQRWARVSLGAPVLAGGKNMSSGKPVRLDLRTLV